MPVQMYRASPVSAEVYLRSNNIPVNNMVSTRTAQSFMTWLNGPSTTWNTAGQIGSLVGAYDGDHDANPTPTTALQIGTQQDNNTAPNTGNSGNGIMVWTWGGTVLVSTSPTGQGVIIPFNPAANTWFHVAYTCTTWNGTNQTHKLYVNGVLSAQSTNALQNGGVLTHFYLNGFPQVPPVGGTETADVQIDDVRWYNRELSAGEISTIYYSRGAVDGIVNGLTGYFLFEEGVVGGPLSYVYDVSGSSNDMVVQNNGGASLLYTADGVTGVNVRFPHN